MRPALMAVALLAGFHLVGCSDAESARIEQTQARLVGTWLLESESGTVKSRRVLTLTGEGKFRDKVAITSSGATSEKIEYGGEWSYDGANLKRRFLQENGRQFSGGKIRYATF